MKEIRTVGIIGLGKMGMPMARLLRERGFTVIGYDATLSAIKAALGLGIQPVMPAHERAALRCG
jgi:3-hydroxyisobutyrate dehydrogenase-like beta-hydroxyacid dehydrogenase